MRGADVNYTFAVTFIDAINGAKKRVVMADGKALDVAIPAGLRDGQTLRLRGKGQPGFGDGEPGDALVEVHVTPHPIFRREGNDIRSTLPVTPGEALAGAKVHVATVSGSVDALGAEGIEQRQDHAAARRGGAVEKLETAIISSSFKWSFPIDPDEELIQCITEWEAAHPFDPRAKQGAQS